MLEKSTPRSLGSSRLMAFGRRRRLVCGGYSAVYGHRSLTRRCSGRGRLAAPLSAIVVRRTPGDSTPAGSSVPDLVLDRHHLLLGMGIIAMLAGANWLSPTKRSRVAELPQLVSDARTRAILGRSRFLWTLDRKELTGVRDGNDDGAAGRGTA